VQTARASSWRKHHFPALDQWHIVVAANSSCEEFAQRVHATSSLCKQFVRAVCVNSLAHASSSCEQFMQIVDSSCEQFMWAAGLKSLCKQFMQAVCTKSLCKQFPKSVHAKKSSCKQPVQTVCANSLLGQFMVVLHELLHAEHVQTVNANG